MPSSTSAGSPGQRPRRRVTVTIVALLAALAVVAPFAAPAVADGDGTAPAARSAVDAPHGNATDGNLTRLVGPSAAYDALEEFGDVATAHRAGALERRENVRVGDTLVLSFRSERIGAEYADTAGPNASVRFFEALDGTNASLTVTSFGETECGPLRVDLRDSRHRVLANASTGEFRLLLDTDHLAAMGGCDDELDVPGGYEVATNLPTADGTRRQTTRFDLLAGTDRPRRAPEREIPVYRAAPALDGDLRTAGALRRGIRTGRLERSSVAVPDEVVVVRLRSARLDRAYANATGANATQRLLRAANATGGRFVVRAERPGSDPETTDTGTETSAPLALSLLGPGVSTAVDRGNDTFYLVVDTSRARLRQGSETLPLVNGSETYLRPSLSTPGSDPERYRGRLVLGTPDGFIAVARNASVDGGREVAVVGTDGEFVARVGTNLAVGSELEVRVRSGNETLARRTVSAEREGLDRTESPPDATFDLGTQPVGRTLTLTLARNGTTIHEMDVLVGERPALRDAIVRRVSRGPEGSTVRFAVTARFPGPGYVVVQNRSGRYVGFEVPTGEPTRVTGTVTIRPGDAGEPRPVRLIAVYDSNRNGRLDAPREDGDIDVPFRSEDGSLLAQTVRLPPPSPTATVTAPPPGTTLAVSEGQPGFGVLAMVGALGAVALLVRRR